MNPSCARKSLLLLLFVLVAFNGYSQKYYDGYYISLKGDTSWGSILYKQWRNNPSVIEFNDNKAITPLKPGEVKEVHINGYDTYISYVGTKLANPINLSSTSIQVDSTSKFDHIDAFLRVLYGSKETSLLLYEGKSRSNFYLRTGDKIEELIFKVYTNEDKITSVPTYRQQLLLVFKKEVSEKGLFTEIEQLRYDEGELLSFIKTVFGDTLRTKKVKVYPTQRFVQAGLAVNHINNYKKNNLSPFPEGSADFGNSAAPVISAGFIFYNQRKFGKVFFSPQLKIYSFKNSGPSQTNSGTPVTTTVKSGPALNLIITGGYNFVSQKTMKWGVSIGGGCIATPKEAVYFKLPTGELVKGTYMKKIIKYHTYIESSLIINDRWRICSSFSFPAEITFFCGNYSNLQFQVGLIL